MTRIMLLVIPVVVIPVMPEVIVIPVKIVLPIIVIPVVILIPVVIIIPMDEVAMDNCKKDREL